MVNLSHRHPTPLVTIINPYHLISRLCLRSISEILIYFTSYHSLTIPSSSHSPVYHHNPHSTLRISQLFSSHSSLHPCLSHSLLALFISLLLLSSVSSQSQPLPCQRWAQQTTVSSSGTTPSSGPLNPTLWIQGGQLKTRPDQSSNTWTNALLSLDLSKPWNTGSPSLSLIRPDSGDPRSPPAVSLGALWSSADGQKLYLWGGQFSDNPTVTPGPMNMFEYDTRSGAWSTLSTSGDSVLRPSEGAGAVVPGIGTNSNSMAYYFGGHLDWASVPGWSNSTPRVFLDSLVQFDMGSLSWKNYSDFQPAKTAALASGVSEGTPTIRADGTLTYVPQVGTSAKGVLVAIGGGRNYHIDNSALDVFDLATQTWVKQATQGKVPPPRVNHCAVRGTAKVNGNPIHQIFVYGGQIVNGTAQSTDMYILTIPGFTWTFVGDSLNAQPVARAGHTCDLIGSQMIVVGGYVASDLLCDSQSVYVFDTTYLTWKNTYNPGLPYKTPEMLASLVGGTGTGHATSSAGSVLGGDGTSDPDVSTPFGGHGGSGSVNTGAVVGGVLAAVLIILLLILAWFVLKKKAEARAKAQVAAAAAVAAAEAEAQAQARKRDHSINSYQRVVSGMYFGSEGIHEGMGYGSAASEDMAESAGFGLASDSRLQYYQAASDDPEHETERFEPQFSTRLVPKQQLRIMNPEEDPDGLKSP
ncbi:hypothetical protein BY996DRAFT_4593888 [Phakopsora pachyrhizi]|nr:hypothetical protein BY996DRAFT_4593888 [Phakopsora pachyrhizi]